MTLSQSAFYRPVADWTVRDAEIIAALAQLVEGRPARGFWKCRKRLRCSRKPSHHKRIYRVYKRMNLHLRRRAKRRLPKRERVALYVPRMPDTVWSADFMSDALICQRRFRKFNVVDDCNREAWHIEVDTSINSERLLRVFAQLHRDCGLPQVLHTDNGPEFLGKAITQWAKVAVMAIHYIQPGKPNHNAFIERFNRTLPKQLLAQHLFARFHDVREAIYWWMIEYNEKRTHDSLGDLTPVEYRNQFARNSTLELST
jgi:putative transposase